MGRRQGPDLAAKALIGYVVTVAAVSALTAEGLVSPTTLAASATRVAHGRVWLLVTSGLTVDTPVILSLLSLTAFAAVTTKLTGARVAVVAGAAGHVFSALIAYALLEAMRLGQPWQFGAEVGRPDFGVSAVCAAWLGAAAGTRWSARPSRAARALVVASTVAVAATAYRLHPGLSVIASEHVFAFCTGLVVVMPSLRRSLTTALRRGLVDPWRRAGLDPVLGVTATGILLVAAVAVAPSALATADAVAADHPASVARCVSSWNDSWLAPRALVGGAQPAYAFVRRVPRVDDRRLFHDCSLTFYGGARTLSVWGRWSHGRVSAWRVRTERRPPQAPANAKVVHAAGVRLERVRAGPHR